MRLDFEAEDQTWSVVTPEGEAFPFMTMVDDSHVKMIDPAGQFQLVELSESGLQAYRATAQQSMTAAL